MKRARGNKMMMEGEEGMNSREDVKKYLLDYLAKEKDRQVNIESVGNIIHKEQEEKERLEHLIKGKEEGIWVELYVSEDYEQDRLGGVEYGYMKVEDILGKGVKKEEILKIKRDKFLYKEFENRCWELFIDQEIETEDQLYQMLELIIGAERGDIMQTKVDSIFDEKSGGVYLSYKVKTKDRG